VFIIKSPSSLAGAFDVFVDIDRQPPEVVTAYRTSKIEKYWRAEA